MRRNFMTGLAILLPVFITYWLVVFFVRLLTQPFLPVMINIFHLMGWVGAPETIKLVGQMVILCVLFSVTMCVGFLGHLYLGTALFNLGDRILQKIPIVNKLYRVIYEVVHSLFRQDKTSFSAVALVPFPTAASYAIGFITQAQPHPDSILVFVPGTPNPSAGYMLSVPKEALLPLNLEVQKALKFVVSGGLIHE